MKNKFKIIKLLISMILICSMIFPSYATLSSSDGSFFVTKAEFDAALADFNGRLTMFEAGINSKIDSQVTSYLDRNGIWSGKEQTPLTTNACYVANCLSDMTFGYVSNGYVGKRSSWDNTHPSFSQGSSVASYQSKCHVDKKDVNDRKMYVFSKSGLCNIEFYSYCEPCNYQVGSVGSSYQPGMAYSKYKNGTLKYSTMPSLKWMYHSAYDYLQLGQSGSNSSFLTASWMYEWEFNWFARLAINATGNLSTEARTVYEFSTAKADKPGSLGSAINCTAVILATSKAPTYHNTYFFVNKGECLLLGHTSNGSPIDTGDAWMPYVSIPSTQWASATGTANVQNDLNDGSIGLPLYVCVNKCMVY